MTKPEFGTEPDISLVIVNYNVKEYLANLLHSVYRAHHDFRLEIFVVDNYSTDGSVEFLRQRFPDVHYIANDTNLGFGKANNQAIRQCKGKYTLIVNPDVLIGEDTLQVLYDHMETNPGTGASGCKILNPDGTFAPESRRSIPTPMKAMYKVLGLTTLFPKSSRFASYYMGGTDENTPSRVEVLSGSFMFYRTDVLQELEGFDERFFMYGEDIDLCYRTLQKGYHIDYVPETSIIHYKGESTKKENLRYIITFNKALYQFFEKHYSYGYSFFFRLFILLGIVVKSAASYVLTLFNKALRPVIDLGLLNLVTIIFFLYRYEIHPLNILQDYQPVFLVVNLMCSVFYLLFAKYYSLYGLNKYSISSQVKAIILTFVSVVVISFFVRDFAFSRLVLVASASVLLVLLPVLRYMSSRYFNRSASGRDRLKAIRVIIAGIDEKTQSAIRKIRSEVEWNYEIVGLVSQDEDVNQEPIDDVPLLGHISQLPELVASYKADQVVFILDKVRHIDVLKSLSQLRDTPVVSKVVPNSLDYIIGKSNVEYFDDVPVVDLELSSLNAWNRFLKRNLDFWVSGLGIILLSPVFIVEKLRNFTSRPPKMNVNIFLDSSSTLNVKFMNPPAKHKLMNTYLFLLRVLTGEFSLVGAPIIKERQGRFIYYKPGLTGLRQLNEHRLFRDEEKERYEMHYLQSYTIWKDLEILFASLRSKQSMHFTEYIGDSSVASEN